MNLMEIKEEKHIDFEVLDKYMVMARKKNAESLKKP